MARYTGPVCRMCRVEQKKLMLKGNRCKSDKCPMNKNGRRPERIPSPVPASVQITACSFGKSRNLKESMA